MVASWFASSDSAAARQEFLRGNGRGINLPWRRAGDRGRDLNRDTHVIDFGPSVLLDFSILFAAISISARLRSLSSPEAVEHAVEDESITPETDDVELEGTFEGIAAGK